MTHNVETPDTDGRSHVEILPDDPALSPKATRRRQKRSRRGSRAGKPVAREQGGDYAAEIQESILRTRKNNLSEIWSAGWE